uniref:C2H2-type domain-containing protein n=1 Tax=Cacopsylla melanoneura TaxID=428564 RepID=A0A8D8TCD4_9HEMI
MFSCFGCKRKYADPSTLAKHMEGFCKVLSKTKVYPCGQDKCFPRLSTRKTFISHLKKIHSLQMLTPDVPKLISDDSQTSYDSPMIVETPLDANLSCLGDSLRCFYSKLYANPQIPRNTVQGVAQGLQEVFSSYNSLLKPLVPPENTDFHALLTEVEERVDLFSTERFSQVLTGSHGMLPGH